MDSFGISAGGMRVASLRVDAVASKVARLPEGDALAGDLVEARSAARSFDANARVLRGSDEMVRFLLDVTA